MHLILQGGMPAPLPLGIVEDLLARADIRRAVEWTPAFKIGQAVRIVDGAFMGIVGKLEHLDAAGRVRMLLELLGRHVFIALRREALMAVA